MTTYGLRNRFTGSLARLITDGFDDEGRPVPTRYRLSVRDDEEELMLYEAVTPAQAALVKAFNTPWETSSQSYPAWGVLDMSEYEVAEITKVNSWSVTDYKVPRPVTFDRLIGQRPTTIETAALYLGAPVPFEFVRKPLSFGLVPIPEGESLESLKEKCTGRFVLVRDDIPQMCVGVTELPTAYAELFTVEKGAGLILTRGPA